MKTTKYLSKDQVEKQWYLIDATDKVLGRLCTHIAKILMGKNKPTYTPNADTGDFVVVINAEKVKVTGKKAQSKTYSQYSGYPSGLKVSKFKNVLNDTPDRIIKHAVKGMLPHTKLGRAMIKKLKIQTGSDHPYIAQQPQLITVVKERT